MSRLRSWQRISLGVLALLAIPALVEAHTLTGSGGWWDEMVCLVPALLMVAVVLFVGRDGSASGKQRKGRAKPNPSGSSVPPGDTPS